MLCARLEVCVAIKVFVSFRKSKTVLCIKKWLICNYYTINAISQCMCAAQKKCLVWTKFEPQFFKATII